MVRWKCNGKIYVKRMLIWKLPDNEIRKLRRFICILPISYLREEAERGTSSYVSITSFHFKLRPSEYLATFSSYV